jgi:acyl-CoA thioesterase-1
MRTVSSAVLLSLLLLGAELLGQTPDIDRIQSLERQLSEQRRVLRDYGGLIRYGSDNSELRPPAPGENRVIFLGDQITEYWGSDNHSFFPGKPWLNRGIAGQTTDQMVIRFRQDVISLQPKLVIILGGINDIAGLHGPATEEVILDNFKSMAELARVNGLRVVLASVTPVCDCFGKSTERQRWQEKISELNELIRKYCGQIGATWLDYYSEMAEHGNMKQQLTKDGVLPNEAGYRLMARLAEKAVEEALSKP